MEINTDWFSVGKYEQFNLELSSGGGKEPFITIKGCRIVEGSRGPFISWPATKNEKTLKYWNHVWPSEAFAAAVLAKAQETKPKPTPRPMRSTVTVPEDDLGDEIPF